MKIICLIAAATLVGCTSTPYDDFTRQIKHDIPWVSQTDSVKPDRFVFGCRQKGDCDDRALCAACRLVQSGVKPSEITVVTQGWVGSNPKNHMSLEYNNHCLLGYGASSYEGLCKHFWGDKDMKSIRTPLDRFIKEKNPVMECEGWK